MPKKKNPTIYDVAEISGVSISTISRVLNSPDKVNSETHKRVMQAIDRSAVLKLLVEKNLIARQSSFQKKVFDRVFNFGW